MRVSRQAVLDPVQGGPWIRRFMSAWGEAKTRCGDPATPLRGGAVTGEARLGSDDLAAVLRRRPLINCSPKIKNNKSCPNYQ